MASKKVSRRYALNEFNTIGLILIIYCLFVLFIPLVLNELIPLMFEEDTWNGINISMGIKTISMVIGTLLPFSLLKLASRKHKKEKEKKIKVSFKQTLCQSIVFFTLTSASIFAMTAIANFFGADGELVSGIGISIDSEHMNDFLYVVTFIFISPILEEFAFRGILLDTLSKYGKFFALYASAIIYSLAHGSFLEFLPSFIMGILLGKLALRYKSIKPVISIHIIFNLLLYLSFIIPENMSYYIAAFYALIYITAVVLYFTRQYKHISVRKSNSNSKVTIMFLTTFSVVAAMLLFIAHSVLTMLLR